MQVESLRELVLTQLSEYKAIEINEIDVTGLTSITDWMIIASGTSDRHIKSIAEHIMSAAKAAGQQPLGAEGLQDNSGWILVDLNDVIVHLMLEKTREFYQLEKLWSISSGEKVNAEGI